MNGKLKQIIFPEMGRAELVSESFEAIVGPRQVAGPSLFSLISSGTEVTGILSGNLAGVSFPAYPGYASVFRIEETGSQVDDLAVGDVVFCMGHHRSYHVVDSENVVPVPESLPPSVATLSRLMTVSMTTLITTRARPGDTVLVSGLGPVGLLASLIFKHSGYRVVGIDPVEERREAALERGIDGVIPLLDPQAYQFKPPALVVECSGSEDAVVAAVRTVRKLGEVVLVGVPWARSSDTGAYDLLYDIFHRYVTLRSGWEWELPRHAHHFDQNHTIYGNIARSLAWLDEWTAAGKYNLADLMEIVSINDAPEVYQGILNRSRKKIMTVFNWREV